MAAAQLSSSGLILRNPHWIEIEGLSHGITTRAGLPDHGKLDFFDVLQRARARRVLPDALTLGGDQVHEDCVAVISEPIKSGAPKSSLRFDANLRAGEFPATDALLTTLPGVVLVIQTADCLPIFFVDPVARVVALAHCGWRGLRTNLTAKVTDLVRTHGGRPEHIQVWLGPCIRAAQYEVGADLVNDFTAAFPGAPVSPNGTHLDLAAIARWQLEHAGLRRELISDSGACTRGEQETYHSYRAQGPDAGRMLSFIGLDLD